MKRRVMFGLAVLGLLVWMTACGSEERLTSPAQTDAAGSLDKDGTETLGPPSIPISGGSGFVEGGVGMAGVDSGVLEVNVPAGATVQQVLLYWSGGTSGPGDDTIALEGTEVVGTLIGGPTHFFYTGGQSIEFSAYRADVTNLGVVQAGANTLTVSGFDFTAGGAGDENNGCSVVVIYDDGGSAALDLRDGLDMAYFGFEPTLDATVPQVFTVAPGVSERTADLLLMVASVGEERANHIRVTTGQGEQVFTDVLGSSDGMTWDSLILPVTIPAGDTEVSVEVVSTAIQDPRGASLGWVGAGLAITSAPPPTEEISGTVFVDADGDGQLGPFESGIGNVVLDITDAQGVVDTIVTADDGTYLFNGPAGSYTVTLDLGAHAEAFNDDLGASFTPTTALSVPVSGGTTAVDFGFVPAVAEILEDIEMGELTSDGETLRYWRKVFRRAVFEERVCSWVRRHGRSCNHRHHGGRGGHNGGWGHGENFPGPDELRDLLAVIADLYQSEPYQFTEGAELKEVLRILRTRPQTEEEDLFRELLVTELNFVSGLGLVEEADRVGVLISWGESLLVTAPGAKSFEKDRASDIRGAISVFEAINTGGGGGVDE